MKVPMPSDLFRRGLLLYILVSGCLMAIVTTAAHPWIYGGDSIYGQTFLVGLTARSLVRGQGLSVCSEYLLGLEQVLCFRAARMPVTPGMLTAQL